MSKDKKIVNKIVTIVMYIVYPYFIVRIIILDIYLYFLKNRRRYKIMMRETLKDKEHLPEEDK